MKKTKRIFKNISILLRNWNIYKEKELKKTEISAGELQFIIFINENLGFSQEEITNFFLIDKATTTKSIKSLEKKGFIYREKDKKDKRIFRVFPTKKGKDFYSFGEKILDSWTEKIYKDFEEDEIKQVKFLLEKMTKNII